MKLRVWTSGPGFESLHLHFTNPDVSTKICWMKTIPLTCPCGVFFEKPLNEYTRCTRRGQVDFYCSLKCPVGVKKRLKAHPNPQNLRSDNRADRRSPFRWFMLRVRQRQTVDLPSDLTLDFLSDLWTSQGGICPLTGWALTLPKNTAVWPQGPSPRNASLDRIDNDKGYVQGNVRFVAVMANLARHQFSDEQMIEFCRAVSAVHAQEV